MCIFLGYFSSKGTTPSVRVHSHFVGGIGWHRTSQQMGMKATYFFFILHVIKKKDRASGRTNDITDVIAALVKLGRSNLALRLTCRKNKPNW